MYFCLAFVEGIFLSSFVDVSHLWMLGFLVFGILLTLVLWKYKKIVVIGFCLLFLVSGIWRHQLALSRIIYPEEQNVSFVGWVVAEPDIRTNNIQLTIKCENGSRDLGGKFLMKLKEAKLFLEKLAQKSSSCLFEKINSGNRN